MVIVSDVNNDLGVLKPKRTGVTFRYFYERGHTSGRVSVLSQWAIPIRDSNNESIRFVKKIGLSIHNHRL